MLIVEVARQKFRGEHTILGSSLSLFVHVLIRGVKVIKAWNTICFPARKRRNFWGCSACGWNDCEYSGDVREGRVLVVLTFEHCFLDISSW